MHYFRMLSTLAVPLAFAFCWFSCERQDASTAAAADRPLEILPAELRSLKSPPDQVFNALKSKPADAAERFYRSLLDSLGDHELDSNALAHLEFYVKRHGGKPTGWYFKLRGDYFFGVAALDSACLNYRKALPLLEKSGEFRLLGDACLHLATAESGLNENEAELLHVGDAKRFFHEQFKAYSDSIFSVEKTAAVDAISIRYQTLEKEQAIERLSHERQVERWRKWFFGAGGLGFALLVGLYFSFRQRQRQRFFEQEKALLVAQEALKTSELEKAQAEIAFRQKQLEKFAAHLAEKNELLLELQNQRRQAAASPENGNGAHPSEAGQEMAVQTLFNQTILTEDDWSVFQQLFEQVYPGFLARMKFKLAKLSPGEQRLLLLVRMGCNTPEVARMLGVSVETVRKGRYRLRKKLGMEEERLEELVEGI